MEIYYRICPMRRRVFWKTYWINKISTKKISWQIYNTIWWIPYIAGIENIINNRPVTFFSDEWNNLVLLSPINFLAPRSKNKILFNKTNDEDRNFIEFETPQTQLVKKLEISSCKLNNFRNKWPNEYLTNLREKHKTHEKKSSHPNIVDIVLVQDVSASKNHWKMVVVTNLI